MNNRIVIRIFALVLLIPSLLWISCRKNTDSLVPSNENPVLLESGVIGQVLDPQGNPAENVQVSHDKTTVVTDKNGVFILKNQFMNSHGAQLTFKKSGYFLLHKSIIPIKGKLVNMKARLVARNVTKVISATQGGTILTNAAASVTFKPNSFITSASTPYSGNVKVFAYYMPPILETTREEMPGNLTGRTTDGEFVVLQTMGMLNVELEDESGNPLQLNPQSPAEIIAPIDPSLTSLATPNIPLWHYDPIKASWIEEGFAQKVGNNYVGSVSHFTTWNWDFKFKAIKLKFRLVNEKGEPLANHFFDIKDLTNGGHGSGETNSDGTFEDFIPANSNFEMIDYSCQLIPVKRFSSQNTDLDLDDIKIDVKTTLVKAKLTDCNDQPSSDVYIIDENTNKVYYKLNSNGELELNVVTCVPETINYKIIDNSNKKEKKISVNIANEKEIDLGTLKVCDELEDFLEINIGNRRNILMKAIHSIPDPVFELLSATGSSSKDSLVLGFVFKGFNTNLDRMPNSFQLTDFIQSINLSCSSIADCQTVKFTMHDIGTVGGQARGTFSGKLLNQDASGPQGLISFDGRFSFKRNR